MKTCGKNQGKKIKEGEKKMLSHIKKTGWQRRKHNDMGRKNGR